MEARLQYLSFTYAHGFPESEFYGNFIGLNREGKAVEKSDSQAQNQNLNNFKTAIALILFGLSVVGLPFILVLIFFRGFVLGFTVGFLIEQLGPKGIVLSALSILPQNIIILPCILSIGVTSLTFAAAVIKNKIKNHHEVYSQMVVGYLLLNLFFSFLLIISGLIEGYISPVFIKFYSKHLNF